MNRARLHRLPRLLRPSTWQFLALVATEPSLDELFSTRAKNPKQWLKEPEPWFATDAREHLRQTVRPALKVFEWGSGASTLWWVQQGCSVTSVEHDSGWADRVEQEAGAAADKTANGSATILRCDLGEGYLDALEGEPFDVIVIDGRQRVACAERVLQLHEKGCFQGTRVIFDDSERAKYRDGTDALARRSTRVLPFSGPIGVPLNKMTTIFELA